MLTDSFGRLHDNLRISVTDRCNIRCFYCMPEHDVRFVPRAEILDFEEIERFVRIAVTLGVSKLRVTGGEPLVRRDLPLLIRRLASVPGIHDLALTTNGVLLPDLAAPLYEAGLRRIAGEIRKTARRVNALQQVVIPGIWSQISAIQQALDQQEQEDVFRLKRIKGKIARSLAPL